LKPSRRIRAPDPDRQAQKASFQQADFQKAVCGQIPALFTLAQRFRRCAELFGIQKNVTINSQIDASKNFNQQHAVQSRRPRSDRRREAILSMAAVRHRAWLQHLEFIGQQNGCSARRRHSRTSHIEGRTEMVTVSMSRFWLRARFVAVRLLDDCPAWRRPEFAVIVPLMLVLFFGTPVEFSSGVAVEPHSIAGRSRTLSRIDISVLAADSSNHHRARLMTIAICRMSSPPASRF